MKRLFLLTSQFWSDVAINFLISVPVHVRVRVHVHAHVKDMDTDMETDSDRQGHGRDMDHHCRWSDIVDKSWKNENDEATFCLQDRTLKRWSDIIASKCLILKRSSNNFASKIQNVRWSNNVGSSDHDRKIALSELRPPLLNTKWVHAEISM